MRDTFEDWPLLQTSLCKAISGRSARLQTSGTSTTSFGWHHFTSVARESCEFWLTTSLASSD